MFILFGTEKEKSWNCTILCPDHGFGWMPNYLLNVVKNLSFPLGSSDNEIAIWKERRSSQVLILSGKTWRFMILLNKRIIAQKQDPPERDFAVWKIIACSLKWTHGEYNLMTLLRACAITREASLQLPTTASGFQSNVSSCWSYCGRSGSFCFNSLQVWKIRGMIIFKPNKKTLLLYSSSRSIPSLSTV
jgi:hypothetical protein